MKWGKIILGLIALGIVIYVARYVTQPAPGKQYPDQGRDHIPASEVAKFSYNTTPPTSGPHLDNWIRPGVYATPQDEGQLLHSLEHGYINIYYTCPPAGTPQTGPTGASGANGQGASDAAAAYASGTVSEGCAQLAAQLEAVAKKKGLRKLLVVPYPRMTTRIALGAWTHLDAFDEFDQARIERFIDYHRDHGPEQTME